MRYEFTVYSFVLPGAGAFFDHFVAVPGDDAVDYEVARDVAFEYDGVADELGFFVAESHATRRKDFSGFRHSKEIIAIRTIFRGRRGLCRKGPIRRV